GGGGRADGGCSRPRGRVARSAERTRRWRRSAGRSRPPPGPSAARAGAIESCGQSPPFRRVSGRARPAPPWSERSSPSCPGADAGIDDPDDQIDDEIHADDEQRQQDDGALDDREILIANRIDCERGDAGPGEDGLGDDGAAQQLTELQAEYGDDGNARVAERVLDDDRGLGEALGACRLDEL